MVKLARATDSKEKRSNSVANPIKHISLTPQQAEEKALIVEQIRPNPRGPWVNGKMTRLPKPKRTTSGSKKKN